MKNKIFTLLIVLLTVFAGSAYAQLNLGTGVSWGTLSPSEALVLNENFTGFPFFHTDTDPNQGNSENSIADDGVTVVYGYKNDTLEVPILGSANGKIKYIFYQCAFAPEWQTAYDFRDGGGQTPNVSNGFVEISRFDTVYSTVPTAAGYMLVDLRQLEFVEMIQWSHSSTGGSKRGVMCEISVDDGTTWDTLRFQPGELWGYSFTKDPASGMKESNGFRCDNSAYGMTWEDGIFTSNVMLRFGQAIPPAGAIQTPRIHDLRVYGTYTPPTSASIIEKEGLKIFSANKKIHLSEQARVAVYNISGALVRESNQTNLVQMNDMPIGVYIVKAQTNNVVRTAKVIIK